MRTKSFGSATMAYPDEICFAFNPVYIKISGLSCRSVITNVSSGGKTYTLETMVFNGTAIVNIMLALQMLFDTYNIINERSKDVSVTVKSNDNRSTASFTTIAIWGNIAPGERFNGTRRVRWFSNYPQTVSVFQGSSFEERQPVAGGTFTTTAFDYTFDYTFQGAGPANVSFVQDTRKNGEFLRWIDRHGMLQHWLFFRGEEEIKNDDGGQEITMNYVDREGNSFRSMKRQQYFFSENVLNLCATDVNEEEYTMLRSILTSPVIDRYYINERTGLRGWEPVMIDTSKTKRTTDYVQDFEFGIVLPNTNAQSL